MVKILKHLKPGEWGQVLVIFLLAVTQTWLDLRIPGYMSKITQLVQTGTAQPGDVLANGGWMLLCAAASLLCVIAIAFLAARVSSAVGARLREMLYNKVETFSAAEMNRFSNASLITRSTNDIMQVQTLLMLGLQMLLKMPIVAVGAFLKIWGMGLAWTLIASVSTVFLCIVIIAIIVSLMPLFNKMQALIDKLSLNVRESLVGRYVIRAFNAEAHQQATFEEANSAFTHADQTTNRAMAPIKPLRELFNNGITLAVYFVGAGLITAAGNSGESLLMFSNMVVFSSYVTQFMTAVKYIVKVLPRYPRAEVSARRINEVLDTRPVITDGTATGGLPGKTGEIAFQNVSFRYPGASDYVLRDISFTAARGETVAFIGSTGSGKTTLVNLVPRFYDATEGDILVDGVNVRDYNQEALFNKIGYVPQKPVLFKGTVGDNIAYGENGRGAYTEADITRAAGVAQAEEFIHSLEDGYEAPIAQGGTNISGGQKQRLSIARAVCRKPEVFIFDDSFSALDFKTTSRLQSALKTESAGVTTLVVAQRISAILHADRIVVLDAGRMVGLGTHKELLETCRVYKEIAMSQLSEEELAS